MASAFSAGARCARRRRGALRRLDCLCEDLLQVLQVVQGAHNNESTTTVLLGRPCLTPSWTHSSHVITRTAVPCHAPSARLHGSLRTDSRSAPWPPADSRSRRRRPPEIAGAASCTASPTAPPSPRAAAAAAASSASITPAVPSPPAHSSLPSSVISRGLPPAAVQPRSRRRRPRSVKWLSLRLSRSSCRGPRGAARAAARAVAQRSDSPVVARVQLAQRRQPALAERGRQRLAPDVGEPDVT